MPVPRPHDIVYAPIDIAVEIAKALKHKGHDVDFYAPEGSTLPLPIKTLGIQPLVRNEDEWVAHLSNLKMHIHYVPWLWDLPFARRMFEEAHKGTYDALFFHHPEVALPFLKQYPDVTVVSVLHDPLYDWYGNIFDMYRSPRSWLVSISDHQRANRSDLPWAGTIYNGVDTQEFTFSPTHKDYLLFSGRIVPEKGAAEAVQVARKTGDKLVIAGLVFPKDKPSFDKHIKPFLNDKITYVGYVDREKLVPYYQGAKAMLMPIQWDEPFGMTMVEAMACGTPIIAFNRGSVPEIVKHNETGFVVDTIDHMAEAVKRIDSIDRRVCRNHVMGRFSIEKMTEQYAALFQKLIYKE